MTTQELYYTNRAEIHAKRLSRETLESRLAKALALLGEREPRDPREATHD